MDFARSNAGGRATASTKIVVAGGFGVGKTTLVGSVSEIKPLRTEALVTNESEGVDDLDAVPSKATTTVAMDFGRITPGRGPRPLPVRHARSAPLLVHVGRPVPRRHRRHRAGRHRPPERGVLAAGLLRGQGHPVHRRASTSSRAPSGTRSTEVREALALPPEVPIMDVDARERESAKAALVRVTEFALEQLTQDSALRRADRCTSSATGPGSPGRWRLLWSVPAAGSLGGERLTVTRNDDGATSVVDGWPASRSTS